jgi:GGDEF domain-containing protein
VRYGGDEFVCALPGSHLAEAEQRFSEISQVLAAKIPGASITAGLTELTESRTLEESRRRGRPRHVLTETQVSERTRRQ